MVQMNVEIGQSLPNVQCCGKPVIITEYHENYHSFSIGHKCAKCGSTGSFGMAIPSVVREDKNGKK